MDVRGHSPVLRRQLVFSDVMGEQVQHHARRAHRVRVDPVHPPPLGKVARAADRQRQRVRQLS